MAHIFASKLARSISQSVLFGRYSQSFISKPCTNSLRSSKSFSTTVDQGGITTTILGNFEDPLLDRVLFHDEDDEFDQARALEELVKENAEKVTMMPSQIVKELDKFIIGQTDAKKSIAIALRNRYRRQRVSEGLREEIVPKNILMIGPTGSGKTEIARRIAKLHKSPFVKVEATKYTEVGFHGKDVDTIIQDLAEAGIELTKQSLIQKFKQRMKKHIDRKIIKIMLSGSSNTVDEENYKAMLESGALENSLIEYDIPKKSKFLGEVVLSSLLHPKPKTAYDGKPNKKKKHPLHVVRKFLEEELFDRLVSEDDIKSYALQIVQNDGIVFIDEIDKICNRGDYLRTTASDEGVQRDLLPIIEGTNVSTKYGNIDTSKILFIASGAFHDTKPSDLLPEFQGRLPIRVQLKPLALEDFYRILTGTENSLIKQQIELMKTEGINLSFTDGAIREIATICFELNQNIENIGARRLHTVIEKIVEEVSFNCEEKRDLIIDEQYVRQQLTPLMQKQDLRRFIL